MHNWSRMVAAVVGMAGAALLASLPASAAPATGVEDVIAALGLDVTSEAADYVVMVDTSGSMNAGGRYDSVRRELGKLVDSLDSDDRVSLLTFDTKAKSRFRGLVGANRSAVLAGLPATAKGKHTDLGTAIASGL
ncbi:MAG: vWA domain-containing protein, partial [Propionicimonas sp.]